MLATFADVLVPCAVLYQPSGSERRYNPTISLQVDYMSAAKLGDWVQGEGQVLRSTRNMLFGQALVTSNGETVLRVSGVYKQGPLINGDRLTDPLGLFSHGD
jgi:acyl-coenzyme A thioesterase PaaI-like protein